MLWYALCPPTHTYIVYASYTIQTNFVYFPPISHVLVPCRETKIFPFRHVSSFINYHKVYTLRYWCTYIYRPIEFAYIAQVHYRVVRFIFLWDIFVLVYYWYIHSFEISFPSTLTLNAYGMLLELAAWMMHNMNTVP